jgi:hypothetical protein
MLLAQPFVKSWTALLADPVPPPSGLLGPILPTHEAEPATTSTRYVDPANVSGTASNSNDGTSTATAWLTLQKAAASAPDNCQVFVRACSIGAQAFTNIVRTGWVVFSPAAGEAVSIGAITTPGSRRLRFEGFGFESNGSANTSSLLNVAVSTGASKIRVRRCKITGGCNILAGTDDSIFEDNTFQPGLLNFSAGSTAALITNVTVRGNIFDGVDSNDALQVKRPGVVLIEGNEFRNLVRVADPAAHQDCLQELYDGNDLTIRWNWMHDCTVAQGIFLSDGTVTRLFVYGNLIHDLGSATQMQVGQAHPDAAIFNNTIIGKLVIREQAHIAALFNNIASTFTVTTDAGGPPVFDAYGHNVWGSASGLTLDATDALGTPTYVNAAGKDFRLASGSLGRGTGVVSLNSYAAPTQDRRGVAMPVSGAWDAGSEGRG